MAEPTVSLKRLSPGLVVLAALLLAAAVVRAAEPAPRYALVITNQAYPAAVGRLANPHHDGDMVAAALRRVGFHVTHAKDLTKPRFQAAIADFIATLADAGDGAAAFVYYSGHGAAVSKHGDNFLIPVDAHITHAAQLPFLAIKLGEVIEAIAAAGARSNFIVVDACRNTPFAAATKAVTKGFLPEKERGGVMIAYATEPGNVALDNSAYARALADEIVRPGQPAVLMFRAVRRRVLKLTANAQFPWTRDGLVEEFYFAGAPSRHGPEARAAPGPGDHVRDCPACPELVIVPPGAFRIGSPAGETGRQPNEAAQRRVAIETAFAIGVTEVSFRQWQACVKGRGCGGYTPSDGGWGRGEQPVINVSWSDAQAYVDWLSRSTGHAYRLPSEIEWEYAARAGTDTPYWQGAALAPSEANFDARYRLDGREVPDPSPDHFRRKPLPVSSFAANPFGLRNVHGNVAEWVGDCYRADHASLGEDRPDAGRGGHRDRDLCTFRVLRGGSWYDEPARVRAAYRAALRPATRVATVGFRVARDIVIDTGN